MCPYCHDRRLTLYQWQDRTDSLQAGDSLNKRADSKRVCLLFTANVSFLMLNLAVH